ncbi:MAG: potassium channel protein [Hydrogenophilales bacterium 28-61-23]|nr:MAG: potassium channel protein [Hydrogenophilales bacterium 28-61-23]
MSLAQLLVRLAYRLQASSRYAQLKGFFHKLLTDPRSHRRKLFDSFMIALVLVSVMLLIYEVRHPLGPWADVFEVFVVTVFVSEYLLRMWLYNDSHKILIEHWEKAELMGLPFHPALALWAVIRRKLTYMSTPMAIIDLLSILPSYRPLRFLRLFLLFRLLKLFRYTRNLTAFGQVLVEKRFELYTLSVFVGSVLLIATVAIYLFEAEAANSKVLTLMDALYWAVITLTTVGYGDIVPVTTEGRVVAMVLVFAGIGVISFATSIVVMAFHEKMRELHDNRVFAAVERQSSLTIVCGFGRIGQVVAQRMAAANQAFVIIDKNIESVIQARKHGYLAVPGDATDGTLLANLGLGRQASRILCLTHDDVSNVYITLTARQASPDILIISRANKAETVRKLVQAGANHVVRPYEVVARMAAEFIGQPVAFDALYDVVTRTAGVYIEPVAVRAGDRLEQQRIGEIDINAHHLLLFGVIRSNDAPSVDGHARFDLAGRHFYFNPGPDLILRTGDLLMLIGYQASLAGFRQFASRGKKRSKGKA